jgi:hypothetical protein
LKRRGGSRKLAQSRRAPGRKSGAPRATRASATNTVAALTSELEEAREQQEAPSEVLNVISSSPGELAPVFDAMLANAVRICEARYGVLYLRDGDAFRAVATTENAPPAYVEARKSELRLQPSPDGPLGRVVRTKQWRSLRGDQPRIS